MNVLFKVNADEVHTLSGEVYRVDFFSPFRDIYSPLHYWEEMWEDMTLKDCGVAKDMLLTYTITKELCGDRRGYG